MGETRKLAAILVSDVVGYSRLAGADEDRTLARLRALRSDLIDPTISVHHGRIVKRTGDGSVIEFRSVVDAVRCAIEVQHAMVERNAGVRARQSASNFASAFIWATLSRRADGDLMGDGVNIAARLEGIAEPGAICLSEDAYRQVKGRLDLAVTDLGPTQLKNIAEPIRVYSLRRRRSPPTRSPRRPQRPEISVPAAPVARRVAVRQHWRRSRAGLFRRRRNREPDDGSFAHQWLFRDRTQHSLHLQGQAVDLKQIGRESERSLCPGGQRPARRETECASMSS